MSTRQIGLDENKSSQVYDTYKDRLLSGALEKIHIDTAGILCTLSTLQLNSIESSADAEIDADDVNGNKDHH